MSFTIKLFVLCFISYNVIGQNRKQKFQNVLDSIYKANIDATGIMIHVESPDNDISWTSAVGIANKKNKAHLNKKQPVLIASNTKTYVAVAILKLVENGALKLDEPIHKLLNKKSAQGFSKAGYNLNEITIRHLLSHTSGIKDFVTDEYFEFVKQHPKYQWTRVEQIAKSINLGEPLALAGKKFSYGDINYLLLTEIIENKTQQPFYTAIRNLINYKRFRLNNTWFIDLEKQPETSNSLACQYSNKYKWDSHNLNPSWDLYGGGGLVATTKDVALFFQALFEGRIIEDKQLLKEMYSYVLPKEESNYCLGVRNIPFNDYRVYYHGGFWGTDVIYIPEINTSIAIFTLQKDKRNDVNLFLGQRIILIIQALVTDK